MSELRIIFMGTPEFAVPSLEILVKHGKNVVGVITAPDKPQGRGKKMGESLVKVFAKKHDLKILQPTNLKDPEFLKELKALNADLQVVVAFRMLPEVVWDMPRLGTFNLHGSLLPQYRGAAPINWAIINGEMETGVTTFLLQHEIDTGKIIFQEREPIKPDDNVGSVYERLMIIGARLVLKTVEAMEGGKFPRIEQDISVGLKPAPKIFKEDCEIDWTKSSNDIHNFVRGLSPYPGAWTTMHNKHLKVFATEIGKAEKGAAGTFIQEGNAIGVITRDGVIWLKDIQLEGKKRMGIEEFLKGYRWPE